MRTRRRRRLAAALLALGVGAVAVAVLGPGAEPPARSDLAAAPDAAPPSRAAAVAAGRDALEVARLALAQGAAAFENGPQRGVEALPAMERALGRLGEAARGADAELQAMERALRQDDADLKPLLAVLAATAKTAAPLPVDPAARAVPPHPDGVVAAGRAAMLLGIVGGALEAEATALAGRLERLDAARHLRAEAEARLEEGLRALAAAREDLRRAVATGPAEAAPPDPAGALARIVRESDTLTDFAAALSGRAPAATLVLDQPVPAAEEGSGLVTRSTRNLEADPDRLRLIPPVHGRILRRPDEPDAAGIRRPGVVLAAPPEALVMAPAAGEVRYVGPFLDYQRVVALVPAPGFVIVLAGLAETVVAEGTHVTAGAPLGFLGGRALAAQEFLMLPRQGGDALGAKTLYMEIWRGGASVDPLPLLEARNG